MIKIKGKGSKTLPNRAGLNEVVRGKQRLTDYSKAVRDMDDAPVALVAHNLTRK